MFAFSSENWQRPADEVLSDGSVSSRLREEVQKLHSNGVRFRVVGDVSAFRRETRSADRRGRGIDRSKLPGFALTWLSTMAVAGILSRR